MNKDQIRKNLYHRVRLRPVTRHFNRGVTTEELDDDWIIEKVNDVGVQIKNTRTDHITTLGFDQIHSYMSDPNRNHGGLKCGFLILHGQLLFQGSRVLFEPTERPGKPIDNKDLPLSEVIDWLSLTPTIRSYLVQHGTVNVSDAIRIDFDDIVRQKNIGKVGVRKLATELVGKGILRRSGYIKKFL
jgi:hypothetical protein